MSDDPVQRLRYAIGAYVERTGLAANTVYMGREDERELLAHPNVFCFMTFGSSSMGEERFICGVKLIVVSERRHYNVTKVE